MNRKVNQEEAHTKTQRP